MGRNKHIHPLAVQNFPFDPVDVERAQVQEALPILRPNFDMIALHRAPAEAAHEIPEQGFHWVLQRGLAPVRKKANATALDRKLFEARESVKAVRTKPLFDEHRDVFLMTKDRRPCAGRPFDHEGKFRLLDAVGKQHEGS